MTYLLSVLKMISLNRCSGRWSCGTHEHDVQRGHPSVQWL